MKRTNIVLEKNIHAQAKAIAAIKGISLNDYLSQAIEKYAEEKKKLFEVLR
ncbi:toxin-antitoxin system HicB family antitoxin [Candidatus Woesearchaeota archaeon]|nr:toxin-antitoxin system HicB family antitoxin [Candidatus Woesearchaeota archaeon]